MPRATNKNLQMAIQMAINGMEFYEAWKRCSMLEGGATDWVGQCHWNAMAKDPAC